MPGLGQLQYLRKDRVLVSLNKEKEGAVQIQLVQLIFLSQNQFG